MKKILLGKMVCLLIVLFSMLFFAGCDTGLENIGEKDSNDLAIDLDSATRDSMTISVGQSITYSRPINCFKYYQFRPVYNTSTISVSSTWIDGDEAVVRITGLKKGIGYVCVYRTPGPCGGSYGIETWIVVTVN